MKIKLPNGIEVTLEGVDEITAAMPALQMLTGHTVVAPPVLAVVPAITEDEMEDFEDDEAMLEMGLIGARTRVRVPNPPAPEGRWPDLIYLTDAWNQVYSLLKEYPEGMTSEEMAILLESDKSIVSGWSMRLRDATPLIMLKGRKHLLTEIGSDPTLTVKINNANPGKMNKMLGWQRFTARSLRDGRRKRRR